MGWLGDKASEFGNWALQTIIEHPLEKLFGIDKEKGDSILDKAGNAAKEKVGSALGGLGLGGSNTGTGGGSGGGGGPDDSSGNGSSTGKAAGGIWDTLEKIPVLGFLFKLIHFVVEMFEGLTGLFGGGDNGSLGAHLGQEGRQKIKDTGHAIANSEPVRVTERTFDRATGHKAAEAVNYLTDKKVMGEDVLTEKEAIAMVANMQRESGLNEKAIGDGGQAKGLEQWHPDRQKAFQDFIGHSINEGTFAENLRFAAHEVKHGKEKGNEASVSNANGVAEAAEQFDRHVERSGNQTKDAATSARFALALEKNPDVIHRGDQGVGSMLLASADVSGHSAPLPAGKKPTLPNLAQPHGTAVTA